MPPVENRTKVAFVLLFSVALDHHSEKELFKSVLDWNTMLTGRKQSRYIALKEEKRMKTWENQESRNVVNRNYKRT